MAFKGLFQLNSIFLTSAASVQGHVLKEECWLATFTIISETEAKSLGAAQGAGVG